MFWSTIFPLRENAGTLTFASSLYTRRLPLPRFKSLFSTGDEEGTRYQPISYHYSHARSFVSCCTRQSAEHTKSSTRYLQPEEQTSPLETQAMGPTAKLWRAPNSVSVEVFSNQKIASVTKTLAISRQPGPRFFLVLKSFIDELASSVEERGIKW